MSVFKKSCFECGAKVDKVKDNLCIDCYKALNPPISEIKPLNVKLCTTCGKIHYNNQFYEIKDFKKQLPIIMNKRVEINKNYKLNELKIRNFEINGRKLVFDVRVDCDFKE